MKTKLLVAALAATAIAAPAAHAKVKVSGQVNQAAILSSDLDDIEVVDNNNFGSLFRFTGAKKFGDLKAGFRYELQAQDNSSSGLEDKGISEVRVSDVYLAGSFGKIAIGKGSGAADGSFESFGLLGHYLGGDLARLTVGSALTSGVDHNTYDGTSRENRIRYDSPNFSGFKFAISVDNGGKEELAAHYNGKVAGGKLRVRVGNVSEEDITSWSVAYQTSFGLGLGYSDSENDSNGKDGNWATVSYKFGKFVAQYAFGDDSDGDEFSVLGLNYKPTKGVEIYLNRADAENADGTEGDATYLGSRIKF